MNRAGGFSIVAVALVVGIVHCGGRSSSDAEVAAVADSGTDVGARSDVGLVSDGSDGSDGEACPPAFPSPGSACSTEGMSCNYCHMEPGSASMLGTTCDSEVCKGGTWKLVPRMCPCPTDPPVLGASCYGNAIGCSCGYGGCGASRQTFRCQISGLPPASWSEVMPAVPCGDAGM